MSKGFARLQRLLPQHALSRLTGKAAASRMPWLRKPLVHAFMRAYDVDLSEAEHTDPDAYASFNAFFTRALQPGARPLDPDPLALLCPADGTVSQAGTLDGERLLQAKGSSYRLSSLAAAEVAAFHGGSFVTVYLAPRDYHRVHVPIDGRLTETTAVPGELYSVNAGTEAAIAGLFCRNERLVCRLQSAHGQLLVVLVGAMVVASIETVWGGPASPYRRLQRNVWDRPLQRGAELGRFLLGSTVIVCCEPGRVRWRDDLRTGTRVQMGQRLGTLT